MSGASDPVGTLDVALAHAARLLATQPALAAEQAEEILKVMPGHPAAALILGSARRATGDAAAALVTLEALSRAQPKSASVQYELALTLAALGRGEAAVAALRRALQLKPDLADAWRRLGDHLSAMGDSAGADAAYANHVRAATRDPRLLAPAAALAEGRIAEAEALLRDHLKAHPTDVAAIRMLAEVAARLGRLPDAEHLLALRFRDVIADASLRPMAEVAPLVRREVSIDPEQSYTELGVRSFYKGTFHRRTVLGSDFSWQDLYRIQAQGGPDAGHGALGEAILLPQRARQGRTQSRVCVSDEGRPVRRVRLDLLDRRRDGQLPAFRQGVEEVLLALRGRLTGEIPGRRLLRLSNQSGGPAFDGEEQGAGAPARRHASVQKRFTVKEFELVSCHVHASLRLHASSSLRTISSACAAGSRTWMVHSLPAGGGPRSPG
jgi:tetratricopeptide (TPR) repeat protein